MDGFSKELKLFVTFDGKQVRATIKDIGSDTDKVKQSVQDIDAGWQGMATGLNQAIELAGKFFRAMNQPVNVAGQFEQYKTTLKVMLGSITEADKRFREMVDFAAKTPFNVSGVVEAGNQLQTINKYSIETLKMLGDLASASGRPMEQAMEAYTNLVTGRTGIAVKQFRMMLISTEDWARQTGKKVLKIGGGAVSSVKEMLEALPNIVAKKGFTGLMDAQSKTFLGMVSNMEDAIQRLQAGVGDVFMPKWKEMVTSATESLAWIGEHLEQLGETFKVVGGLAIAAFSIKYIKTFSYALQTALAGVQLIYENWGNAIEIVRAKFTALFATIAAHPLVALGVAVVAVVAAVRLWNAWMNESVEVQLKNAQATESLIKSEIQDTKVKQAQAEQTLENLRIYEKYSKQLQRTTDETDEYNMAVRQLRDSSIGNMNATKGFEIAEKDLHEQILKNQIAINDYRKSLEELATKQIAARVNTLRLMAAMQTESMLKRFKEEADGFLDKATEYILGDKLIATSGEVIAETYLGGVVKGMYDAKNLPELEKASENLRNRITEMWKNKKISATTSSGLLEDADTMKRNLVTKMRVETTGDIREAGEILDDSISLARDKFGKNYKGLLAWLDTLKKEVNTVSADKGLLSGIVTGFEEKDTLTFLNKTVDDTIDIVTTAQSEYKAELDTAKDEGIKNRKALMTAFTSDLTMLRSQLDNNFISLEDYNTGLQNKLVEFQNVMKTKGGSKNWLQEELSFQTKITSDIKERGKIYLDDINLKQKSIESQITLDGKYKESHLSMYENLLSGYTDYVNKYGTNQSYERDKIIELTVKIRELKKSQEALDLTNFKKSLFDIFTLGKDLLKGIDFFEFLDTSKVKNQADAVELLFDKMKKLSDNTHKQNVAKIDIMPDDSKRTEAMLAEDKRYTEEAIDLYTTFAGHVKDAMSSVTDDAEKQKFADFFDTIKQALSDLGIDLSKILNEASKSSKDAWMKTVLDIEDKTKAISGELQNIFGGLTDLALASNKERADAYKASMTKQLDVEQENAVNSARTEKQKALVAEDFAAKREAMEEEYNKKRTEGAKTWFEVEKAAKIASAIANTAEGVTKALAQGGIFGAVLGGLVAAAGAVQIALIAQQKFPEYDTGGYVEKFGKRDKDYGYTGTGGKKEPAGIVHRGEYVIDADKTKKYKSILDMIQKGTFNDRGYEGGGYISDAKFNPVSPIIHNNIGVPSVTVDMDAVVYQLVALQSSIKDLSKRPLTDKYGTRKLFTSGGSAMKKQR